MSIKLKYPKTNFTREKACGLLIFLLTSIAASAAGLDIEKGSVDLLQNEALSRPFTRFDQLLYSLEKEVVENAKYLLPEKNDFTLLTRRNRYFDARVMYEKEFSRVVIAFSAYVSAMNDPWRQVCERHVRRMADVLGISGLGSQIVGLNPEFKAEGVRLFFSRHLSPNVSLGDMPVTSFQPFLDAVVVVVKFSVERADNKGLAYLRDCALDIKNNHMKYYEHKY